MEFNETQTMAIIFTKMAKEKMGDKVKDFCILDVYDDATEHSAWNLQHMIISQ